MTWPAARKDPALDESTTHFTRAIATGDREAFARFYSEWFDRVCAMARKATGRDESFCLDVAQDAFVRVIRGMRPVATQDELAAYMKRVTLTAAYDRLRREKRGRAREAHRAGTGQTRAGGTEGLAENTARLREELARLDATTAWMIDARFRMGWTLERIGRTVGMKTGAVDGRVRRGVTKLGEALGRDNG